MNNTPEKRVETPRHDHLLYEEACNLDVPWSEEYQKLEQELQQANQKIDEHNWNQMAWEENQELLAKTTTQLQQAREELAQTKAAWKAASDSEYLYLCDRLSNLQSQLSQWQECASGLYRLVKGLFTTQQQVDDILDRYDELLSTPKTTESK